MVYASFYDYADALVLGQRSAGSSVGQLYDMPPLESVTGGMMARNRANERRERLRKDLWPGKEESIWGGPSEKGYWCAPRVLPLLLKLTSDKKIVAELDCSSVYIDLLSRDYGQGFVEILDEDEHAYCSGYTGSRAKRTWQERVKRLAKAGFIEIKPRLNKTIGYVLIVHPYKVATALREQGKIEDQWWQHFCQKLNDVGGGEMLKKFENPDDSELLDLEELAAAVSSEA